MIKHHDPEDESNQRFRRRRDYLATKSMASLIQIYPKGTILSDKVQDNIVRLAYSFADKMIIKEDQTFDEFITNYYKKIGK